jgi:hypothetical protein
VKTVEESGQQPATRTLHAATRLGRLPTGGQLGRARPAVDRRWPPPGRLRPGVANFVLTMVLSAIGLVIAGCYATAILTLPHDSDLYRTFL